MVEFTILARFFKTYYYSGKENETYKYYKSKLELNRKIIPIE